MERARSFGCGKPSAIMATLSFVVMGIMARHLPHVVHELGGAHPPHLPHGARRCAHSAIHCWALCPRPWGHVPKHIFQIWTRCVDSDTSTDSSEWDSSSRILASWLRCQSDSRAAALTCPNPT